MYHFSKLKLLVVALVVSLVILTLLILVIVFGVLLAKKGDTEGQFQLSPRIQFRNANLMGSYGVVSASTPRVQ